MRRAVSPASGFAATGEPTLDRGPRPSFAAIARPWPSVLFVSSRPAGRALPGRQRTVSRVLFDALAGLRRDGDPVRILDCGGGSGSLAVPLAEAGATVTVVDISVDALATLTRRATEAGVASHVRAVQGDIEALAEVVPAAGFDLVLVHGVLDVVDAWAALVSVAAAVRAGGLVSLLVANPAATVLSRLLAGELDLALAELRSSTRGDGFDADRLAELCARLGLSVEQVHGVGVFTDFVPASSTGSADDAGTLAELEDLAAATPPYRDIAANLHVLARRPGGG